MWSRGRNSRRTRCSGPPRLPTPAERAPRPRARPPAHTGRRSAPIWPDLALTAPDLAARRAGRQPSARVGLRPLRSGPISNSTAPGQAARQAGRRPLAGRPGPVEFRCSGLSQQASRHLIARLFLARKRREERRGASQVRLPFLSCAAAAAVCWHLVKVSLRRGWKHSNQLPEGSGILWRSIDCRFFLLHIPSCFAECGAPHALGMLPSA